MKAMKYKEMNDGALYPCNFEDDSSALELVILSLEEYEECLREVWNAARSRITTLTEDDIYEYEYFYDWQNEQEILEDEAT